MGAARLRREMERRALSRHQWACTLEPQNRGRVQARRPWTSDDDQALSDAVAAEELPWGVVPSEGPEAAIRGPRAPGGWWPFYAAFLSAPPLAGGEQGNRTAE